MIPRSIRWRLPLSYAAIALLAALSLGAVLLVTLRGYYRQRELEYLTRNAQTISVSMAQAVAYAELPPEALQVQVESLSFLSQTRVRLLGTDDQVLADSGVPEARKYVSLAVRSRPDTAPQVFTSAVEDRVGIVTTYVTQTVEAEPGRVYGASIILLKDEAIEGVTEVTQPITQNVWMAGPSPENIAWRSLGPDASDFIIAVPAAGTPYGFGLSMEESSVDGRRSDLAVRQSLCDADGVLQGYVELSDGPAYGRQIVNSVAWGWAIAGTVAVVIAAVVGWLISRNISTPLLALTEATSGMASGDLAVRAQATERQDEFGTLAHSFNRMADRVEETVITLRCFVYDAAHEIHTPLTALRTNLELAPDDEFVRRAQVQVERLATLTEGLLDLSHIEALAKGNAHVPVSLIPLMQETSELYASQAEQAGLAFALTLPDTPVTVRGDERQLRRALGNLVDNAIKFTPEGGTVEVRLHREDHWVGLWVEDTGIGIPTEDLPHLFSRFHRGRNAAAYPGSGLGLAIVKAIAESHGGTVAAENAAQGARFRLRLPLID